MHDGYLEKVWGFYTRGGHDKGKPEFITHTTTQEDKIVKNHSLTCA